jgi:hypothetical protein
MILPLMILPNELPEIFLMLGTPWDRKGYSHRDNEVNGGNPMGIYKVRTTGSSSVFLLSSV